MDAFYHSAPELSANADPNSLDNNPSKSDLTIYVKLFSILFVRAGLFLSQVSSIPSSNIQILIFQNIIDVAVNTVAYSLIGYLFAYGRDASSFIGVSGFLGDNSDRDQFVEGWLIVVAVSGLLVAAIGDRISSFAGLVLNTLISGFVFPIIIHWVLTDLGWMRAQKIAKVYVSFKDYNFSCLIHMSGGFLAFISMLILNKRLLRFKDMDVSSIPDNGPALTLFGNFFMIIGFLGIGIPTEKYFLTHLNFNFYGIILINMLLSAFGAVTATLLLTFTCPCEPMHKWTSMRSIQAGIAGIAVIAGGADVYYPMVALLIGACDGFLYFLVSFLVNISPIEDYSNIIACHFLSGFIGTLLPPLLGIREGFNISAYYTFMHFLWQFICDLVILSTICLVFFPVLILLDYCGILRSWDEDINHRRALFARKTIQNENNSPPFFGFRNQQVNVAYLEPGYKTKDKATPADGIDPQEKVDVLFEKRQSDEIQEDRELTTADFLVPPEQIKNLGTSVQPKFENESYHVNYMLHSKPMAFFEEVNSDSRRSSSIIVKDCGDAVKNSRFFDLKLLKGIRNISDSKLLRKFNNNCPVPKKRAVWTKERDLRFGSISNIWVPSSARISLETQV